MARPLLPKFQRISAVGRYETAKWTDENSIYYRLPEHYKRRHQEFLNRIPEPVHYIQNPDKYEVDHETGTRKVIQNVPIVLLHPKESNFGIWGGEGVIAGYKRPKYRGYSRHQYITTKLWRPQILKKIFYSEILDRYYALTCTKRTLLLIDDAKGFDHYILKTHQVDLKSDLAMNLKREMLVKLAKKDTELYPNDSEMQTTIYNRYKQYELPLEEAEWVGLKLWEAVNKLKEADNQKLKDSIKPHKELFTDELLNNLEQLKLEGKELPQKEIVQNKKSLLKNVWEELTKKKN